MSFEQANSFIVAKARQIEIAPGERLQMKFNGQSTEGKPIRNGELVTVQRVLKDGRIRIQDDARVRKTLRHDQRLLVQGYAVTSYASQGKTVDTVLTTYASAQAPANQNQWYVAISRARKNILVLTEDKEALRTHIEHELNRPLALSIQPQTIHSEAKTLKSKNVVDESTYLQCAKYHCKRMKQEKQMQAQSQTQTENQSLKKLPSQSQRKIIFPPPVIKHTNRQNHPNHKKGIYR